MLTAKQITWAADHDWFIRDNGDGSIEVRNAVTLGGLYAETIIHWTFGFRALRDWAFDAAFLSGEAMDGQGISNSHASIAAFQQAVMRRTRKIYFCLDASKLGRATPHRVAPWKQPTALTTDAPPRKLAEHGIILPAARLLRV